MSDIQRADPKARRHFILFTLATILVLLPILAWLYPYVESIEGWLAKTDEMVVRVKLTIIVLTTIGSILLLILAIYTFRFAGNILHFERYPPAGVKVIRDVRIRRGNAARWIGRLIQAYSVVVLVFLVSIIVASWFLIQNLDKLVLY